METELQSLLKSFTHSPELTGKFPYWSAQPSREARYAQFPDAVSPTLRNILIEEGITSLYAHQAQAIELIGQGKNVVISTGTASGKSLCYQIPILNDQLKTDSAKALMLFPTKALANDQFNTLQAFCKKISAHELQFYKAPLPAIYDGDTPSHLRPSIRDKATILFSNPDMLHLGILPHHTNWEAFFTNLKYIVIDEIHIYRGVFGSHVANVIRRLNRISLFYGAHPQFILTSATIANPAEHAAKLIDQPIDLVDQDSSPHGESHFIFYNPPIIHEELGVRQGLTSATLQFANMLLRKNVQTLLFTRSRRSVEFIIHELRNQYPQSTSLFRGYRSGYLKADRREIEQGLKSGQIKMAVATNALELGVDIGGVDLVMLAGYPGTVSSTRQRAGRAGRKNRPSAVLLVASANPLDQFLCRHPEYLMERNPEMALFDPDNPLILMAHLQCAAFELAFHEGESFGSIQYDDLSAFLRVLEAQGVLLNNNSRYIWTSQEYPANNISLRSTATRSIALHLNDPDSPRLLGSLDYNSSLWMAHPGAIYLHEGDPYLVKSLDLEKEIAELEVSNLPYYTEPVKNQEISILQDLETSSTPEYELHLSEIEVKTQVTGFKRIDWTTHEILSLDPLEMPSTILRTYGYWFAIQPPVVEKMRSENMWFSDPNNYGVHWERQRNLARQRDQYRCCLCGAPEYGAAHHVHHKIPFRLFTDPEVANDLNNLVTLCPNCHRIVEVNVKIRSAISGLSYSLYHLAPLLVMCDENDLGAYTDPAADFADKRPAILIYDSIPAGMGLAHELYKQHNMLLNHASELIDYCQCEDGCPSCVGPISETGIGGKKETKFLLSLLKQGIAYG